MITASYVSQEMGELDAAAKKAGIIILNEIGLDPGLDHMEAMRIIRDSKSRGGQVKSFISYCGGLPSPESKNNPLGYKFSWSPIGVLMAGKSPAQYLKKGKKIKSSPELFLKNTEPVLIPGIGKMEAYPNRDSFPYIEIYGIPDAHTVMRATLRFKGWCSFIHAALISGLLNECRKNWEGYTYKSFIQELLDISDSTEIKPALCRLLSLDEDSEVIRIFDRLGLFKKETIPMAFGSPLEILAHRLQEKLNYKSGERDMIILQHKFEVSFSDETLEQITSTLIDYGVPDGDSAMAKTVGLPLAMAARQILEGNIIKTGVQIPVFPEIYEPILKEFESMGIAFKETRYKIKKTFLKVESKSKKLFNIEG